LYSPANEYSYLREDSNEAGQQFLTWKAGNLWRYEPFDANMTGHILGTEYNPQTTLSGIPAMVPAVVRPIAINDAMVVNPFRTNAVMAAQIHSWQYEEIANID
jgi:hypothetical protein